MTEQLFSVAGKRALVTGGSRGIGKMIARGLVQAGADVIIVSRSEEACKESAAELSQYGSCRGFAADLTHLAGVEALAAQIDKLDILVNNAGTSWGAELGEFPEKGWDKVMDVNLKSVFFLTQALLPVLEQNAAADKTASIINIGSVDALHVPATEGYSYGASKAALHHLTKHLAQRLAARHIRVNAIAPGPFETKMTEAVFKDLGDTILARSPMSRFGQPDDIAGPVLFLASRASAFVTGVVMPVDGGSVSCI